ncbi:MAG: retropepsin-like aspartic protease [Acidobacteriota bacterium]
MKHDLLCVIGSALAAVSGCASVGGSTSNGSHPRPISIALATGPFGALLAPTTIDETHRVWMLIDTGASTSSLDRSVAARLGLQERTTTNRTVGVGGSGESGGLVAVRQMQVAGASYGPIDLHTLDLSDLRDLERQRGGPTTDGILGADFLAPLSAVIDYGNRRLILTAPNATNRQFYVEGIVILAPSGAPTALTVLQSWPKKIDVPLVGANVAVVTAQGRVQSAQTDVRGRFKLGPITAGASKTIRSLSITHQDALPYSLSEPGDLLTTSRVRLLISVGRAR